MRIICVLTALALAGCDDGETAAADVGAASDALASDSGPVGDIGFSGEDGGTDVGPEIDVDPPILQLLGAVGQTSEPVLLTIRNLGTDPLEVSGATIVGAGFDLADVPDWPQTLAPGDSVTVGVTYTPPNAGRHEGAVTITSDDADEAMTRVPLNGRISMSCVRAMPSTLDLGGVEPGAESGRFQTQIVNCGDAPLNIGEVTQEGDEGFGWEVEGGDELANSTLTPGQAVRLRLWYANTGLAPGETTSAQLVLVTDAPRTPELRINLRARGGDGPSCLLQVTPERLDFEFLRIGRTAALAVQVDNVGTEACRLDDVRIIAMDGPDENTFEVTMDLPRGEIAGSSQQALEITYAPTVAYPPGDRVLLRVEYHDPNLEQNRAEEVLVRGVGAEALVAAMPAEEYFGEVTVATCASRTFTIRADNAGFVPMCFTGFRYEGPECDAFIPLEEPEIEGDCVLLQDDEFREFRFQYEPLALRDAGQDRCELILQTDAMNFAELPVPLLGDPVESDATTDEYEVGELRADRSAFFGLRRLADGDSVRVTEDGEPNDDWEWDEGRNSIEFPRRRHPAEGSTLVINYDARCFDRVGD